MPIFPYLADELNASRRWSLRRVTEAVRVYVEGDEQFMETFGEARQ